MKIEVRTERERGCGFRRVGANGMSLYFVGPALSRSCGRLPYPLGACKTCGEGYHQFRGVRWIDPRAFFGGDYGTTAGQLLMQARGSLNDIAESGHAKALVARIDAALSPPFPCQLPTGCHNHCPMAAASMPERALLMVVGEKHYPSTASFLREANEMGVSKRLGALPKDWEPGTLVYLAHPKAVMPWDRGWTPPGGVVVDGAEAPLFDLAEAFNPEMAPRPGVFSAFIPTLEVVLDTTDPGEAPEYAHKLAEKYGDAVKFVKVEHAPEPAHVQAAIPGDEEE